LSLPVGSRNIDM
jgi:hypothetical protein